MHETTIGTEGAKSTSALLLVDTRCSVGADGVCVCWGAVTEVEVIIPPSANADSARLSTLPFLVVGNSSSAM